MTRNKDTQKNEEKQEPESQYNLYIKIDKRKEYLSEEIIKKYQLKPGECFPFTDYKIFEEKA